MLHPEQIAELVAALYIKANRRLPQDIADALQRAAATDTSTLARRAMRTMLKNLEMADPLPICQDTGMALVFCDWGGQARLSSGTLQQAVDTGIARACSEGFLRRSVVGDPLRRTNTGDNTPAVLHTRVVEGDKVRFTVAPKGFGSENMTTLRMFTPAHGAEDILEYIDSAVTQAGANPCPPVIVGVGLGGTADQCTLLAKQALLRPVGSEHPDPFYADLERTALARVNALKIGAQGLGGDHTALAVHFEVRPTHIAGLPCVVSLGCWVTRHASGLLSDG